MATASTHLAQALISQTPKGDPAPTEEGEFGTESETKETDWAGIVTRIRNHENAAMEELYVIFAKGIRYYLCRQLGPQELDDKVHDTFLIVVQAIRRSKSARKWT
jgi:hypothetical protein